VAQALRSSGQAQAHRPQALQRIDGHAAIVPEWINPRRLLHKTVARLMRAENQAYYFM
jgi:hypothetical protein